MDFTWYTIDNVILQKFHFYGRVDVIDQLLLESYILGKMLPSRVFNNAYFNDGIHFTIRDAHEKLKFRMPKNL